MKMRARTRAAMRSRGCLVGVKVMRPAVIALLTSRSVLDHGGETSGGVGGARWWRFAARILKLFSGSALPPSWSVTEAPSAAIAPGLFIVSHGGQSFEARAGGRRCGRAAIRSSSHAMISARDHALRPFWSLRIADLKTTGEFSIPFQSPTGGGNGAASGRDTRARAPVHDPSHVTLQCCW